MHQHRHSLLLLFSLLPLLCAAQTDTVNVSEAVVTGTRSADGERDLPQSISVLSHHDLNQDFRPSLLPTLSERVPSMFVTSRSMIGYGVSTGAAGTMKVRGIGGGGSLLVLIDGEPQYAALMGHPLPDAYQTLLAERVEVLRGPASTLYGGGAMGGVVNIVTPNALSDGVHHTIRLQGGSYGTAEAGVTNTARKGKFSSTVAYDYARTDGHRANMGFQQHSAFVKLGYDITTHWKATADANFTYFKSSNPGPVTAPLNDNDQEITRGFAALALTHRHERFSGGLRLYTNFGHHHINDGYAASGGTPRTVRYIHNDLVLGLSLYETMHLFTGNRLTLGLDYQHYGGNAYNRNVATHEHIKLNATSGEDFSENEVAAYADLAQRIAPWLTLTAGLRADHHSQTGTELVPQGGLTFHLLQQAEVRLLVSKGFRNPTLREMYMFPPQNDALRPERLVNYEISYRQPFLNDKLHVGFTAFYLKAKNLIQTNMIDGKPHNVNTGALENSGVEFEADYKPCRTLRFSANYSYLWMSRVQEAAPEHKFYFGAEYSYRRFAVNAGLQYIGKLHTSTDAAAPTESFWLLNATAAYQLLKQLKLFVKGDNLLAQRYETLKGFPMPRATVMAGVQIDF